MVLYFHEADPVSIHILTGAAYDVLRDVSRTHYDVQMIKDWAPDMIKPEYVKEFRNGFNRAQNFFKHADRDGEATLVKRTAESALARRRKKNWSAEPTSLIPS